MKRGVNLNVCIKLKHGQTNYLCRNYALEYQVIY